MAADTETLVAVHMDHLPGHVVRVAFGDQLLDGDTPRLGRGHLGHLATLGHGQGEQVRQAPAAEQPHTTHVPVEGGGHVCMCEVPLDGTAHMQHTAVRTHDALAHP